MGNKKPVASLNTREYDGLLAVLKEARKQQHVSQEELSARLGQSVNYISKIELRERRLDVVEFIFLAKALEVDPIELLQNVMKRVG